MKIREYLVSQARRILPHKKKVFYMLIAFIVAWCAFQCVPAQAETRSYTRVDMGARIIRYESPVVFFSVVQPGPTANTSWQYGIGLVGSTDEKTFDCPNYENNNGLGYGMLVATRGRIDLGLGVGSYFRQPCYSGSRVQFMLMARVNLWKSQTSAGRFDLTLDLHASNAGTSPPNPGADFTLFGGALQW